MRSEHLAAVLATLGTAVILNVGCTAQAHGAAYAESDPPVVFTSEPMLVEVDSGVWVVRDYDYPVYYVNDDYWVVKGGVWYHSHSYDGGWVVAEANVVPAVIVHRDHQQYVRFHGSATAQVRVGPRGHVEGAKRREEHAEEHHEKAEEHRAEERHEERADEHREHAEEHHEAAAQRVEEHRAEPHNPPPGRGKKHEDKHDEKDKH